MNPSNILKWQHRITAAAGKCQSYDSSTELTKTKADRQREKERQKATTESQLQQN